MRRLSSAAVLALCAGSALAQTATVPPHASVFNGNTRGYWFVAPTDFRITGVQALQAPGGTNGFMNWAVVKFDNNTPPPTFAATTNAFVQVGLGLGLPSGSYSPVSIDVLQGEVIGVYGNTIATPSATTGSNSYTAASPQGNIDIFGNTVPITRSGMQFHLGSTTSPQGMHDIWTELASSAVSRVEFTYEALGVTGACCLPDGSCQARTQTSCTNVGGTYNGDGSLCGSVTCPQPGACCFSNGTCSSLQAGACTTAGGVFGGAGTACGAVPCASMGRCCFADGSCSFVGAAACAAAGGNYGGGSTLCGTGACPQPTCFEATGLAVPIVSTTVNGTQGPVSTADLVVSASQTITSMFAKIQVAHTWQGDARIELKHPDGTTIDLVTRPGVAPPKLTSTAFGFSTDNYGVPGTTYMTFIDSASNVYDDAIGFPGPPAGASTATNNVVGPYKAHGGSLNTTFGGKNTAGTWQLLGSDYAGGDEGVINAVAICLPGTATGPACYPNCDGSTVNPCLNVGDFSCFLNSFASGASYANCDGSTTAPVLNVGDFSCFLNAFASGCSSCV